MSMRSRQVRRRTHLEQVILAGSPRDDDRRDGGRSGEPALRRARGGRLLLRRAAVVALPALVVAHETAHAPRPKLLVICADPYTDSHTQNHAGDSRHALSTPRRLQEERTPREADGARATPKWREPHRAWRCMGGRRRPPASSWAAPPISDPAGPARWNTEGARVSEKGEKGAKGKERTVVGPLLGLAHQQGRTCWEPARDDGSEES